MNNDLISRSKLIEELIAYRDHTYQTSVYWAIDDVIDRVKEQPTAYDVEKVCEELENRGNYFVDPWVSYMFKKQSKDIVKRGGADEN